MLNSKGRAELSHSRALLGHGTGRNRIETSINCVDDIKWTSMILRGLCDQLDDIADNNELRPAYVMSIARRQIYHAHRELAVRASENNDPNVADRWDSNLKEVG
tara:strand:- start:268 stop:579 length:312 start_codon:yes stop_codon:yes gene_type:complete